MNRLITILIIGFKRIREPYYHGFAAQVAFFYMMSLVPLSILLAQMFGAIFKETINDSMGWFFETLGHIVGSNLTDILAGLLTYQSAGAANIVYVFIALWAASRGQFALTRIMNHIMSAGKTTGKGYWLERIRSLVTMFLLLLSIVLSVGVIVYGGALLKLLANGARIWLYLRWPIALALFFLVLSFIYFILPMKRPRYRDVIPGAVFAAVGLVAVTWAYSLYVSSVAQYDIIYGTLANLVALMFWFYFMAWVLVLGAMFNRLLIETGKSGTAEYYD